MIFIRVFQNVMAFLYICRKQNYKTMTQENFQLFLWIMSACALVVFVALYFVKAGYGIFRTSSWGFAINNRWGWLLMEAPVFVVMLVLWWRSDVGYTWPAFLFFLLFELHYFQRSFIFPFLMNGKSKMPIAILLMGMVFNILNGIMQAGGLFYFPAIDYAVEDWYYFLRPQAMAGLLISFFGMMVNWHSDRVIRQLRKPGDTAHYLPQRGFYRYVTSANYFGELVEWVGFALLTASPAAWVFAWWTFANLVPRAYAINQRYRREFGSAVGNRKCIIPFIY